MTRFDTQEPLTLIAETLEVSKREVERARVIVRTRVEERQEFAEMALRQDEVEVERVTIGREVAVAPEVREEDGVLIVPVLEEQLVVSTQLILKEEIRIRRRSRVEDFREPVSLRSEHAEVVRTDSIDPNLNNAEGNPE